MDAQTAHGGTAGSRSTATGRGMRERETNGKDVIGSFRMYVLSNPKAQPRVETRLQV